MIFGGVWPFEALPTKRRRNFKTVSLWKRVKYFPSTLRRRNLKTHQSAVILDLWKRGQGSHVIIVTSSFLKSAVSKCFPSSLKRKPAFSNSSGLKRVFKKLRCDDGLVWTVGLTVKVKVRLQISSAHFGHYLRRERMYFHSFAKNQGQKSVDSVYKNSKSRIKNQWILLNESYLDDVFCSVITCVFWKRNLTPTTTGCNREIKLDVVLRQTAKMTSEFVFFSSNPSLNHIKIEKKICYYSPQIQIFSHNFNFSACRLT